MTAIQLQMEYLEQSRKYVEDRYGADADDLTRDVLDRWESVLTRLETDPMQLSRELDWVAKLELLEGYRAPRQPRLGRTPGCTSSTCSTPTSAPSEGLYNRLVARGRMELLVTEADVQRGHRAPARGHPRLLPRPLPGAVRRHGRRGLLGLGHLRRPRPRLAAARPDPGAAPGHQGARRRAARPLPHRGRTGGRPRRRRLTRFFLRGSPDPEWSCEPLSRSWRPWQPRRALTAPGRVRGVRLPLLCVPFARFVVRLTGDNPDDPTRALGYGRNDTCCPLVDWP